MSGAEVERTFCFVDLAGFSALTQAHGDADAVAVLERFWALTTESVSEDDELVKTIGDAVMLASPSPDDALRLLEGLWRRCAGTDGFPLPRGGAHHGSAIARDGDYLGAAVNLAARVAAHAGGSQLLSTAPVARAARATGTEVVDLGSHPLRNLPDPVELFEIRLGTERRGRAIDPVCRMAVEPDHAAGYLRVGEKRLWFCSLACAAAFAAEPGRYPTAER